MTPALSILVWIPAAGALAVRALNPGRTSLIRGIAVVATCASAMLAAALWFSFEPRGDEWQFAERLNLFSSFGVSYALGVDGYAMTMVLVTAIVGAAAALSRHRLRLQYASGLTLQFALFGAFMSLDVVLWLAFVCVILAALSVLVPAIDAPDRSRLISSSSTIAAIVALAAGVLALFLSYHTLSGAYTSDLRLLRQASFPRFSQIAIFAALAVGFALALWRFRLNTFCGVVLLHVAAFTVVRVHLAVLPDASRALAVAFMTIASVAAVYGAFRTFAQADWRTLAWYASASQIAAAIAGAFALTPSGIAGSMVLASLPAFGVLAGARPIVEGLWQVNRVIAVMTGASLAIVVAAMAMACWRSVRMWRTAGIQVSAQPTSAAAMIPIAALALVAVATSLHPSTLSAQLETSVARVVLRVSPEYAPDVADCLSKPPPTPAETGLPPGVVMAAPCAEGTPPHGEPPKK
jgi:NADH:ubiquinone oxidoreductase subunit 4 (subunit M)